MSDDIVESEQSDTYFLKVKPNSYQKYKQQSRTFKI